MPEEWIAIISLNKDHFIVRLSTTTTTTSSSSSSSSSSSEMSTKQQPLFKDLKKRSNDLLTKDFPSEKQENKVEWKTNAPNNVTFTSTFTKRKDGSVVGTVSPKYVFKDWNTTFTGEVNTRRELKGEVEVANPADVAGLKVTATAQSSTEDNFGILAVQYQHELASLTGSADYGKGKGSTVKGSIVTGAQGFALGASCEYFLGHAQDSDMKEFEAAINYSHSDFDIRGFARMNSREEEDKNIIGASYYHKVHGKDNKQLALRAEVVYEHKEADAKPQLVFGTEYQWERDTTLKAKFDTTGLLGFSYRQKFSDRTSLTLASTMDTNNLGAKNAASFGFSLNLVD